MIKEKLNKAVNFHKMGNLDSASSIYREIINIDPNHPDANHNLGTIISFNNGSEKALPFLEMALNSNKEIEQYWLSYIDALINANKLEVAKQVIIDAKEVDFKKQKFDELSLRLLSPYERYKMNDFYKPLDMDYNKFLSRIHQKKYNIYFEIGSRSGHSLNLSNSPSIAIDPFFQIAVDPVNGKDFCLLFQEKSDDFFEKTYKNFTSFKSELSFIDGMHFFEYALRDFINLSKISLEKSLFLFHDVLPWSFEMATRDFNKIPLGKDWTGDVWKLIPIFIEFGMIDCMKLISSAPTGILALLSPDKEKVFELENNFHNICRKWMDVTLNRKQLKKLYSFNIFEKPDNYLKLLDNIQFGTTFNQSKRKWISH